jgi:hypothetical protein
MRSVEHKVHKRFKRFNQVQLGSTAQGERCSAFFSGAYRDCKTFTARSQDRRVEVTFADGEAILGTTLNYRPDGQGFFVSPADPGTNNTRIFVVSKRRLPACNSVSSR